MNGFYGFLLILLEIWFKVFLKVVENEIWEVIVIKFIDYLCLVMCVFVLKIIFILIDLFK